MKTDLSKLRQQNALMRGALIGIGARIRSFRRICRDYTDTGDAWELLDTIERVSGAVLPVDPPKPSKRLLRHPGAKSGRSGRSQPKKGNRP